MSSEPYVCSKCNKSFASEEKLNEHIRETSDAHDFIHDK